jgi:parallel beta-helix repeat protein
MNRYVDLPHTLCSRRLTVMRTTWALALVAATLAPGASAVDCPINPVSVAPAGVTDIVCPTNITSPGRYRLAEDCAVIAGCSGISITPPASDVHLNLGGHTISGPGTPGGVGIAVNRTKDENISNVHVNGGTVKGFETGIQVSGDNNHLNGLTVTENVAQGLELTTGDNNHVDGNNISGNIAQAVFVHNHSNNNVIEENVINDNDSSGFLLQDSDLNVIDSNDISGNKNVGVSLIGSLGSNNNKIRGNSINDQPVGITLQSGNNNTIVDNTVNDDSRFSVGIEVRLDARQNSIRRNMALGTGSDRIDLTDENPACDANTWRNNNFEKDEVAGANDNGPTEGCIK